MTMLEIAIKTALEIAKMVACIAAFIAWIALVSAVYEFVAYTARHMDDPWSRVRIARDCYIPDWGDSGPDPGYTSTSKVCIIKAAKP